MRTVEDIRGNCKIEPGEREGHEHWIWQGAFTPSANGKHKTAMCWAMDIGKGKMRTQSVPRALHQMRTGKALPTGKMPRQMCGVEGCVHPDCWKVMSRKEYGAWLTRTGYLHTRNDYFASNRKTWETRGRKLTKAQILQLAHDTRPGRVIGAELGITGGTANRYKTGALGACVRAGVFTGLLR